MILIGRRDGKIILKCIIEKHVIDVKLSALGPMVGCFVSSTECSGLIRTYHLISYVVTVFCQTEGKLVIQSVS